MSNYLKNFVSGHGIKFCTNKRNLVAFEKASELWREIWSGLDVDGDSIIMLCGAKCNGKSTLLRFLINCYNEKRSSCNSIKSMRSKSSDDADNIEMIDCDGNDDRSGSEEDRDVYAYLIDYDPGQCELTSPGVISAHKILASAQPLIFPTYLNTAQHVPIIMSSVGGTNMSVNPRMYIENSRMIFNRVYEHRNNQTVKRPIFINTMGHIRNVGLAMLMDLIKICRPTNLIVLNVADPMRTIYADLSPSVMDTTRAAFYYETQHQSRRKPLDYRYDIHNLQFSFIESPQVSQKNRTALMLAYMATIPEALYKPIMQLPTKWLSLRTVSVYCVSSYPLKEGIVLELLRHSWVHLVKINPTTHQRIECPTEELSVLSVDERTNNDNTTKIIGKIHDDVGENILFGCGIVAEIDLQRGLLSIITPLDATTIEQHVNCVIKPLSIQVPRNIMQEN